ncbi:MAG: DUF5119 domain-containing protein [Muribaculaceae bacterium]|nr:DUF5119 domain-containing protein [Muribaculaceae bacterium]
MMTLSKITRTSLFSLCALSLAGLSLSSCRHKDIDFDDVPMQEVKVVFDWSKAPEAAPASMALWLYYSPLESPDSTLRYDFNNNTGGPVRIPYGSFSGIALNSDNSDWAHFRNTENIETFEIFTREISSLPASGLRTRAVPRARDAEEESMVETPNAVWSGRNDGMSLKRGEREKTLIFYPEELTSHYTVDILDIDNISAIDGTATDATLSGMAGGFLHGRGEATDTRHTLPFVMVKDEEKNSLHGEFLTFGESPKTRNPHKLGLYLMMSDGNKYFYTFDVSNQIYDAPDPKNVHIVVRALSLPQPVTGGNGFSPEVSDWESVDIDLKM